MTTVGEAEPFSVSPVPTGICRPRTVLQRWINTQGPVCPGALESDHLPHNVPGIGALSLDHIIPRSLGGINSWENLRVLCKEYNMLKGCIFLEDDELRVARRTNLHAFWNS